jgi:hypothetical protein
MTKSEIRKYLNSSAWKNRRRRYYASHPRRCFACGGCKTLQLHHLSYVKLGREPDCDIVPLCRRHHQAAHRAVTSRKCTLKGSAIYIRAVVEKGRTVRARRPRRRKAA